MITWKQKSFQETQISLYNTLNINYFWIFSSYHRGFPDITKLSHTNLKKNNMPKKPLDENFWIAFELLEIVFYAY